MLKSRCLNTSNGWNWIKATSHFASFQSAWKKTIQLPRHSVLELSDDSDYSSLRWIITEYQPHMQILWRPPQRVAIPVMPWPHYINLKICMARNVIKINDYGKWMEKHCPVNPMTDEYHCGTRNQILKWNNEFSGKLWRKVDKIDVTRQCVGPNRQ